jgi:hypothetical protein
MEFFLRHIGGIEVRLRQPDGCALNEHEIFVQSRPGALIHPEVMQSFLALGARVRFKRFQKSFGSAPDLLPI